MTQVRSGAGQAAWGLSAAHGSSPSWEPTHHGLLLAARWRQRGRGVGGSSPRGEQGGSQCVACMRAEREAAAGTRMQQQPRTTLEGVSAEAVVPARTGGGVTQQTSHSCVAEPHVQSHTEWRFTVWGAGRLTWRRRKSSRPNLSSTQAGAGPEHMGCARRGSRCTSSPPGTCTRCRRGRISCACGGGVQGGGEG